MVKQARAARTRQALIHAAAEAFSADGYARASLPVISRRAGVSAGALHFHFASKDALAHEVESAAAREAERLAEGCRSAECGELGVLMAVIRRLILAFAADPVLRAGFRLSGDPSREGGTALLDWWHGWVRDALGRAREAGELADGVSPDGVAVAVVAATVGFEVLGGRDRDWLTKDRMADFWALLVARLAPAPGQDCARPQYAGTGRERGAENSLAG